jgi:hypothetical protein
MPTGRIGLKWQHTDTNTDPCIQHNISVLVKKSEFTNNHQIGRWKGVLNDGISLGIHSNQQEKCNTKATMLLV